MGGGGVGRTVASRQWRDPLLEIYGCVVAQLAFLWCWGINFAQHEQACVAAALAAACFFAAQVLSPRDRFARTYFSLLGTGLITLLLGYQSSGSILTVAWGVQGVALLIAGFPLFYPGAPLVRIGASDGLHPQALLVGLAASGYPAAHLLFHCAGSDSGRRFLDLRRASAST